MGSNSLACLAIPPAVSPTTDSYHCLLTRSSQGTRLSRPSGAIFAPLLLLASHRIIRAWNQTGQKHAGEPDIARHLLPAHNYMLWILVSATYADVMQRISRCAIPWSSRRFATAASIPLGVAALGFKIAFTNADAPELLTGLGGFILTPLKETSLVAQARAVLICISFMVLLTIMPIFVRLSSQRAALKGTFTSWVSDSSG